jgi:hypothetical protein
VAFSQAQLDALEAAYAAGVTVVHHNNKTVTYASLPDLWEAILRLRRALQATSRRYTHGRIRFQED